MKICVLFVLCIFAGSQWILSESARRLFIEQKEHGSSKGLSRVQKRHLLEEAESSPSDKPTDHEKSKSVIKQASMEKQKKHDDKETISEANTGNLSTEEDRDKLVKEKPKEKKKKLTGEKSSTKDANSEELMSVRWGHEDKSGKKTRKEVLLEGSEEENILFSTGKRSTPKDIADIQADSRRMHGKKEDMKKYVDENIYMEDKEVKKSSIKQDKKLKMSKSDALQDGNSDKKYVDENMEDKEVKKSSIKQDKKLKMSKSDALQDGVSDLGSSKSLDENLIITKAKKSKVSKSQLEGGSNAMSAETGTSMDLYPKQDDMQPKAKKKVKDNAPNEGQSSYKESGKKLSESHKEAASMSRKETFSKDTTIEDVSLQKGKEQMVVKKEKKSSGEGKKEDSKQFLQANISGTSKGKEKLNTLVMAPSTKAKKMEATKNEGEEVHQTIKKQKQSETKVQGIKKEAQKKVKVVNGALDSGQSNAQIEEEDEYDFMQDFSDLPTKFQDTALKVADHLGSNIQKFTDTSKTYFNKANQQISDSFSPIIGRQFAPFLASLLSYSFLLVPLAVVIVLFERIRVLFSIQKVLLFVNIYLAAYFATLLLATWIIGEPMNFFYRSSASGYVHLQLLQALGYIIYLILQTIDLASTLITEGMMIKVTTVLQWFVAFMIGFHYYVTVFHRAMALKGPHTNWKIYGTYSTTFLALCFFARIKRMKKSYVQFGQDDTDKRH